jgi:hypothetical protein
VILAFLSGPREIAGGTYQIDSVREMFKGAAATLEQLLCGEAPVGDGKYGILSQVFPVERALSRQPLAYERGLGAILPMLLPKPTVVSPPKSSKAQPQAAASCEGSPIFL